MDRTETICHVLPSIEEFLDIQAIVRLSWSCKAFRGMIVDETSGKVKVSHYSDELVGESSGVDALNSIYWPSLIKLKILFPFPMAKATFNGDTYFARNRHMNEFPILAVAVSYAYNLEELTFNVSPCVLFEDNGSLDATYNIFFENLTRSCKKLRKLVILNIFLPDQYNPASLSHSVSLYSPTFFNALIGRQRRDGSFTGLLSSRMCTLEEVALNIGSSPSSSDNPTVVYDLFSQIIALQQLKKCDIQLDLFTSRTLNCILECSEHIVASRFHSNALEHFSLLCPRNGRDFIHSDRARSISSLLSLFNNCHRLNTFFLDVPEDFWNSNHHQIAGIESVDALRTNVLIGKPFLNAISVRFDGYVDSGEGIFDHIVDFVRSRDSEAKLYVKFLDIGATECMEGMLDVRERLVPTDEDAEEIDAADEVEHGNRQDLHAILRYQLEEYSDIRWCFREDRYGYDFVINKCGYRQK
jgi:hypothetical protein